MTDNTNRKKTDMAQHSTSYKLALSGKGIKINNNVSAEVAKQIAALVIGVPIIQAPETFHPNSVNDESVIKGGQTPKGFLASKQPSTDIERITILAYFLDHFRETHTFKTIELTKLNTEAAGRKIANPKYAARNAVTQGFLTGAGGGKKQITARGELLVDKLPNRVAVKTALEANPVKRIRKSAKKRR